jgi:cystathionine beta-lyase/cystathionine gamma-synthase
MTEKTRGIETRLQQPKMEATPGGEPVTSPIYQTSTYVLPTPELGAEIAASWHPQRFYTRYGSPKSTQSTPLRSAYERAGSATKRV